MAFRYHLQPNSGDSHQVNAWWFAAIIRFAHVRTFDRSVIVDPNNHSFNCSKFGISEQATKERSPLLVTNQLVNWQVSHSKASHTSTATFKVLPGKIDWARQVQAGDWVLLWAFDNTEDYSRVINDVAAILRSGEYDSPASRAARDRGVNNFLDGLKFVGRVNAPKAEESVDPSSGTLRTHYNFTGVGFGEFDAKIYYNESFRAKVQDMKSSTLAAIEAVASEIEQSIAPGVPMTTTAHQQLWLNVFLGAGPGAASKGFDATGTSIEADVANGGLVATPNDAFLVPGRVGKLLGIERDGQLKYVDILQTFVGVQGPSPNVTVYRSDAEELDSFAIAGGFVPERVGEPSGTFLPQWVAFENTTTWDLLSQYSNQPLNEMFVSLRVGSDGRVRPTYTLRQNPMSSRAAAKALGGRFAMTEFVALPRWVVHPGLVEGSTLGASDSMRINFVSVQGIDVVGDTIAHRHMYQNVNSPPISDVADIRRNGVRSFITTTNADISGVIGPDGKLTENPPGQLGRAYNKFMADIVVDQALKWNGSLRIKGVQEPIAIGDNLEYQNNVYHIESISHMGYIEGNSGRKTFTTTLQLSNGISTLSDTASDNVFPYEDPRENFKHAVDFESSGDIVDEGEVPSDGYSEEFEGVLQHLHDLAGGDATQTAPFLSPQGANRVKE